MASKVTYKGIYTLLAQEINKKIGFNPKASYKNQQSRTAIAPLSMIGTGASSNASLAEISSAIQNMLTLSLPSAIVTGLEVEAQDPPTNRVTVSVGTGTAGGFAYELEAATTFAVPLNLGNTVYICLHRDGVVIETTPKTDMVTLAKIIIPDVLLSNIIRDKYDPDNPNDPYIQCYQEYKLYGINNQLEENSIELLRDNIGEILADNIIGNLKLSENLKITNSQGTLELNSDSLKLFDIDENVLSKFNRDGVFFYNASGIELAKFTGTEARVGNIIIGTDSIYSGNFVTGAFGKGFQIKDGGDAEFNSVTVRGKFKASVFEAETISSVGGNLLVLDSDILDSNMTALDASTLKISGDTTFSNGDILRIKDGIWDEWFTITNATGAPTYVVTRDVGSNYDADANPQWTKGVAVVNYGQSGDGGIFFTASESNAPYMSIFKHTGSPWSSTDTTLRLGNLNGFLGYSSDLYGIAIGTTNDYLKYDPVGGLQIKGNITITGGDVPSKTYYQDGEPGSGDDINEGDYWIDTNDDNALYIYQSSVWVAVTAGGGITSFRQSAIPTSTSIGDIWIDSDDDKLYRAESVGADQITAGEWVLQDAAVATGWAHASDTTKIDGGDVYTGTVTADKITVTSLSALNANLGTITAGNIGGVTITGGTIRTAATAARFNMTSTALVAYSEDSGYPEVFRVQLADDSGFHSGDIVLGDYDNDKGLFWNNDTTTFTVKGEVDITGGSFSGSVDVGDGSVIIDGVNNNIKVYDDSDNLRVEIGYFT